MSVISAWKHGGHWIEFDELNHAYAVDRRNVRSASAVIEVFKQALVSRFGDHEPLPDYDAMPARNRENAKARGSQIDDAASLILEGKFTSIHEEMLSDESRPYVEAFQQFARDRMGLDDTHALYVQRPLYCAKLDVCCTPDWHNQISVTDLKAQAKASREWGFRLALMALAHGDAIIERIVWLRPHLKTRSYEVHTRNEGDNRIFSKLDYQVVEAACLGDYDAECIKRWRSGE